MASAARKIHMPSLPQLSGVSGDSAGSTSRWCSATATDVTSGLLRLRGLRRVAARPRQLDDRGAAASGAAPVENHEAERRGDEHRARLGERPRRRDEEPEGDEPREAAQAHQKYTTPKSTTHSTHTKYQ